MRPAHSAKPLALEDAMLGMLRRVFSHHSKRPALGLEERISVLAVTSVLADRLELARIAALGNWDLKAVETCAEANWMLRQNRFDVVLLDRDLPILEWRAALTLLTVAAPPASFLLISRVNDEYLVREVVQNGGYDVLSAPFDEAHALHAVNLAWAYSKNRARS